ncbi:unnamed protein product [Lymnaea stagnalis]|uniref:Uncharacterized protein n=1 Tax=Lymnaea stagnalis TaxID=6523 RepID=A0AAV2ICY0_LYMST
MEADPGKQRSRQKRRERTLQLQQEKQTREEEEASGQDDQDGSPPRSSKDKPPRSKPKKIKSALFEEDIIDGFAIMSFKTLEELENVTKKNGCIKNKSVKPQDNNSDTLSLDKDDNIKTKKKKVKKSPSINSCSNIGGDNNGDDSNTGNNTGNNTVNNTPADIGDSITSMVHNDHHHHLHNHNGPLEPPRSISRDRLSDASTHSGSGQGYVCDVESEDDKASESGSDLYSGIPSGGLLNHLPNNGHPNPCVALTAPTPPPSTSSTPTPLCNGIGGTASHSSSPVPHILVASTSTTSTTTTSSTSRPGLSETLTSTTTSPAVTSSAIPSVIQTTPYNPQRPGSKPPQFSPGSSIQPSTLTLSPSSQLGSLTSDTSSCARSLQYSKSLKANHIHGNNTKGATHVHSSGHLSNNTSNLPHHLHQLQQQQQQPYGDNPQPFHLQNGPINVNPPTLSQQTHLNSSFPFQSSTSGSGYQSQYPGYSSVVRPDPLLNPRPLTLASSPRPEQRCPSVISSGSQSTPLNNVSLSTATSGTPYLNTTPINHHQQHSSHHKSSSSSGRSEPSHPHQQYHQSRHSSPSPGYPQKRVCRTPPGLPPPSSSSTTWTTSTPINDTCKKFTPPLPPRGQTKPDQLVSGSGKDSDKPRIKDSSGHHHHHSQHHQSKDHRDREREKDKEREKQRTPVSSSSSLTPTSFSTAKPAWPSSPGQLYSPLIHSHHHSPLTPTSGLHPLGPQPSSVAAQTSPLFPLPLAPPPPLLAAGAPSLPSGMFAPPMPPAPSSLASAPLPSHAASPSQFSAESLIRSQQDFLHQDLNNRLLAHRDSSTIGLPSSQFVRNETHQHQHQHQHLHNHMHQHTYGGLSASPLVPSGPPLFDKMPKVYDTGVFRPSLVPSYSAAFSSLLQPGPSGASIASSLQGAFQPKVMWIHTTKTNQAGKNLVAPGQMLVPFRDREKAVPPPGLPPVQKKQGKWCAVHVRVAWEIYHRQQKQQRDPDSLPGTSSKSGPDTKPLEPSLRPASHLLPSSRPPELAPPPPTSLLSSVARSVPEGIVHPSSSFLTSNLVSGMSAFPRPAPYPQPSLLNPLGFSGLDCVVYHQQQQDMHRNNMHLFPGSSMFAPVRDMGPPSLHAGLSSSPHGDWRLHRAPSSFPTWPKSELEKEKDREKDRERELRKEEERERERRLSVNHRLPGGSDESRHKDTDSSRPKSRSRSRSPLRNGHGRLDHHVKSELGHYDRRYEEKMTMSSSSSLSSSAMKLKEERREDELLSLPHHLEREKIEREKMERERLERDRLERDRMERDRMERDRMERERIEKEKILHSAAAAEREKILQAVEQREKFLQSSGYLGLNPFGAGLHTHPSLLDRRMGLMGPPGVGYPFLDRPPVPTTMWSPFDKTVEMAHRVEMERERERMAMMSRLSSIPSHVAALEQERLKEQLIREQQEREYELRRQYLDRLPAFSADRLRAADPLALSGYFPRTISPMFGPGALAGLKSNSPHMSGVPPPLIPSSSTATMLSSRSHDNSPSSSSKSKGCSPADSTSDLKDKREGNSTDPDTHSR